MADQIVALDQGEIVQVGTHKELMKSEGLYKELINSYSDADLYQQDRVEVVSRPEQDL
jgi:ABC-type transport system involved in cytochrome bd biosynthesis fused ATPase/permease subunit